MFSFRRKSSKHLEDPSGPPFIHSSPSLPELSSQGIPWPSNLVDLSQLPQDASPPSPPRGAAKTSFTTEGPIPFHKPWSSPGKATGSPVGPPIASLYASHPPSAFALEPRKVTHGSTRQRANQKRNRNPTTFNLMVRVTALISEFSCSLAHLGVLILAVVWWLDRLLVRRARAKPPFSA